MALTVPTREANPEGKWVRYTGGLGAGDNAVLLDLPCAGAIEVIAHATTGLFDCFGSMDGTIFNAVALALEDMCSTTPATRVAVSATDRPVRITNPGFKYLRFLQNGATAPTNFAVAVRIA